MGRNDHCIASRPHHSRRPFAQRTVCFSAFSALLVLLSLHRFASRSVWRAVSLYVSLHVLRIACLACLQWQWMDASVKGGQRRPSHPTHRLSHTSPTNTPHHVPTPTGDTSPSAAAAPPPSLYFPIQSANHGLEQNIGRRSQRNRTGRTHVPIPRWLSPLLSFCTPPQLQVE